ncbi:hypothetical protein CAC42_7831 [Sphaceloma murrayae]|uniref:Uncharacterized protein n=1 Tax=Sphaceloma murrayae TaxID=2082308 RepID=A0A2K1QXT8_9PEZI|nr:hypothetical protein CAC42_7831 [Sphaceloma murrayae]
MSAPRPESPLDGHCSAVDNDTLYVLSASSFQALPLKEKATWSKLDQGTPVTNPACVRIVPGNDDSKAVLYVIGGSTDDSNFSGLQRYTFSTKAWETLTPPTPDMVGRTDHSAAYLPGSNSILVYAGSQPQSRSDYSSQTFVISLAPPYNIRSFTSLAPPGNQPILRTFDTNSAVLIGSNTRNKEIWLFNADSGWNKFSTELTEGIAPAVQGLIVDGADGSKVLTTYDATVSPNSIRQIVLLDAGGQPAQTGQTVGGSSKRTRDLRLNNWPAYNSSAAPETIRSDYTVTQNAAGLAVISGGSTDSPVNLFDNAENTWVDNGLFFNGRANDNQEVISTTSTRPSVTSTLPTPSATTSAPPLLPGESSRPRTLRVLGITLGTLCGIAALFIIALLILRWRRQKKRRQANYIDEKGDRMSFQDRGASFMKEAGGSRVDVTQIPPNHRFTQHNSSHNSFAIIAGKLGRSGSRHLQPPNGTRGSSESTRPLTKAVKKGDIRGPVELDMWGRDKEVFVSEHPVSSSGAPYIPASTIGARESQLAQPDKKRSSGWSRYFAAGDGTKLPSAYDRGPTTSGYTVDTNYTDASRPTMPSRIPSSALVAPLDLEFAKTQDGQRISRVATASPSFNHSSEDLARRGSSVEAARGQTAHVANVRGEGAWTPRGVDSWGSEDDESRNTRDTYSTFASSEYFHQPSSTSNWTPVSGNTSNTYDVKAPAGLSVVPNTHAGASPDLEPASTTTSAYNSPDPNSGAWPGGLSVAKNRAPSSAYTASYYGHDSRVISARGNTGFFPGTRENYRPSSRGGKLRSPETSGVFPLPPGQNQDDDHNKLKPKGDDNNPYDGSAWGDVSPGLEPPKPVFGGNKGREGEERESTVTVFPRGVSSAYYADRFGGEDTGNKAKEMPKQDMSWLNLGLK